jgi:hypothetical protein
MVQSILEVVYYRSYYSKPLPFTTALVNEELNKSMKPSSENNVDSRGSLVSNATINGDKTPGVTSTSRVATSVAPSINHNPSFSRAETTPRPYEQKNSFPVHEMTRSCFAPAVDTLSAVSATASTISRRIQEIQGQMSQ